MGEGRDFQKCPVFPDQKFFPLREIIILLPERISGKAHPVSFIGREIFNRIDAIGKGRRSFMGRKISD